MSDDDLRDSGIHNEVLTAEFFLPLAQVSEKEREASCKLIIESLKRSLAEDRSLIRAHLGRIVRFATEVPFDDIMYPFRDLLAVCEKARVFSLCSHLLLCLTFFFFVFAGGYPIP